MRPFIPLLATATVLALAGCASRDEATVSEPNELSLAGALGEDAQFGVLDEIIENAALDTVLDGVGPYTVIAPTNAAFEAIGRSGADFSDEAMRAPGAELVRAHLLPGAITRADLEAAIERGGAVGAEMRTMAGGVLTFRRDGEAIVVAAEDGSSARLTGDEFLAANGVIQPVDAVLASPDGGSGG